MSEFHDSMTLRAARDLLRERVRDGERCPCCKQLAKVYRRKLNSAMAYDAIRFYRATQPGEYAHRPTVAQAAGGDAGKLRYWKLLVEETERRDDGGRSGWWCLTDDGRAFVEGRLRVPKYALLYDGRLLKLEGEGITDTDDVQAHLGGDHVGRQIEAEILRGGSAVTIKIVPGERPVPER